MIYNMRSAQLGAGSDDPREKGEGAHEERSVGSWERARSERRGAKLRTARSRE